MGRGQVDPQPLVVGVRVRPHWVTGTPGPAPRVLAQPRVLRPHIERVIARAGGEGGVGEAATLHAQVPGAAG